MSSSRPRTTSFVEGSSKNNPNFGGGLKISSKDGSKVMTVIASPGQGPDRSTEVSYTDTKASCVILNFVSDLLDAPLCSRSAQENLKLTRKARLSPFPSRIIGISSLDWIRGK